MKKQLVGLFVFLFPMLGLCQQPSRADLGFYGGLVFNHSFGDHWYNERGVRLGFTTRPKQFNNSLYGESLFNSSFNLTLQVTGAKKHQHLSGIQTSMIDETGNSEGFGRVEFSRVSPTLMYDLGFKLHEESIINPYATAGVRLDFYYSKFYEELYTDEIVNMGPNITSPITNTTTLGLGLGVGTKFLLTRRFLLDLRCELYGNWALSTNTHGRLPDIDSFQHTEIGSPIFLLRDRTFQSGGIFSLNMVIFLRERD